jgi:hypothetical protein
MIPTRVEAFGFKSSICQWLQENYLFFLPFLRVLNKEAQIQGHSEPAPTLVSSSEASVCSILSPKTLDLNTISTLQSPQKQFQ